MAQAFGLAQPDQVGERECGLRRDPVLEPGIYGANPGAGVLAGACVAVLYSMYIFTLRQAMTGGGVARGASAGGVARGAPAGPGGAASPVAVLFEATLGGAAGSLVIGLCLHDFRHPWPAQIWPAVGWLLLLAITSQVIGWLLITTSMSRLPAWMIGVVLLIQPAGSVTPGYLVLDERPSLTQLAGVALMLAGVLAAVGGGGGRPATAQQEDHPPGTGAVQGEVAVEVAVPGHDAQPAG